MKHLPLKLPRLDMYPVGSHLNTANLYITAVVAVLKPRLERHTPLNLWVRGSSGAILAALMSVHLQRSDIRIVYVNKEGENSHRSDLYPLQSATNIILDDFAASGTTVESIYRVMKLYNLMQVDYLILNSFAFYRWEDHPPFPFSFYPKHLVSMEYDWHKDWKTLGEIPPSETELLRSHKMKIKEHEEVS